MAGDWIKIRKCLFAHPKVIRMADATGLCEEVIVGWLAKIWAWADDATEDGNADGVTPSALTRVTGAPNRVVAAMQDVKWLLHTSEGLAFPDYEEHMSNSAKKRANTSNRVKRFRNADVTLEALPEKRREEKRRVTKKSKPKESFRKPSVDEVRTYCQERQNAVDPERFVDYYDAQGWKLSNGNPMKNWQSAVRNWERNAHGAAAGSEDAIAQANAGIEQRRRERAKRQAQYAAEDAQAIRPKLRKA